MFLIVSLINSLDKIEHGVELLSKPASPPPESEIADKLAKLLEKKAIARLVAAGKNITGSEFALDFSRAQTPYDIAALFPDYNRYVLEIGSGWGEFALASAQSHPQTLWLALEKKKKRVLRCLKKQKLTQIPNIRWMVLDSEWFFKGLFQANSFDKVVINFPDPWPKKRHHKHRFFHENFLRELTRICKRGAILEFATDYWNYMEESVRLLESSTNWQNAEGLGVILSRIEGRPVTYFQSLKQSEKENVYFIRFSRL